MAPETRNAPRTPKKGRKVNKHALTVAVQRSPNTDRLCTRARELAAKHVVGGDLSADARAVLIQLRTAIRLKKPCEFRTVGQLEELFRARLPRLDGASHARRHQGWRAQGVEGDARVSHPQLFWASPGGARRDCAAPGWQPHQ